VRGVWSYQVLAVSYACRVARRPSAQDMCAMPMNKGCLALYIVSSIQLLNQFMLRLSSQQERVDVVNCCALCASRAGAQQTHMNRPSVSRVCMYTVAGISQQQPPMLRWGWSALEQGRQQMQWHSLHRWAGGW
jgi:hypothetical protein